MAFGTVCMLPNWADGWAGRLTGLLRARWGRVPPFRVFRFYWSKKSGSAPGDTLNHFIGATDVLSGSSLGLNGKSLGSVQGKSILLGSENGSEPLTSLSISFDNQEILGSIDYSGFFEFG